MAAGDLGKYSAAVSIDISTLRAEVTTAVGLLRQIKDEAKKTTDETKKAGEQTWQGWKRSMVEASAGVYLFKSALDTVRGVLDSVKQQTWGNLVATGQWGSELKNTAASIGLTTSEMQTYTAVAATANVQTSRLVITLRTLSNAQQELARYRQGGGRNAVSALQQLGISQTDAQEMRLPQFLSLVATKLTEVKSAAERVSLSKDIFGGARSGNIGSFLQSVAKPSAELRAEMEKLGIVLGGQFPEAADQFDGAMAIVNLQLSYLRNAFAVPLIDAITPVIKTIIQPALGEVIHWIVKSKDEIRAMALEWVTAALNIAEFEVPTALEDLKKLFEDIKQAAKDLSSHFDDIIAKWTTLKDVMTGGLIGLAVATIALTVKALLAGTAGIIVGATALVSSPAWATLALVATGLSAGYALSKLLRDKAEADAAPPPAPPALVGPKPWRYTGDLQFPQRPPPPEPPDTIPSDMASQLPGGNSLAEGVEVAASIAESDANAKAKADEERKAQFKINTTAASNALRIMNDEQARSLIAMELGARTTAAMAVETDELKYAEEGLKRAHIAGAVALEDKNIAMSEYLRAVGSNFNEVERWRAAERASDTQRKLGISVTNQVRDHEIETARLTGDTQAKLRLEYQKTTEDRIAGLREQIVAEKRALTETLISARAAEELVNSKVQFENDGAKAIAEIDARSLRQRVEMQKKSIAELDALQPKIAEQTKAELEDAKAPVVNFSGFLTTSISDVTESLMQGTFKWKDAWKSMLSSLVSMTAKAFAEIIVYQGLGLEQGGTKTNKGGLMGLISQFASGGIAKFFGAESPYEPGASGGTPGATGETAVGAAKSIMPGWSLDKGAGAATSKAPVSETISTGLGTVGTGIDSMKHAVTENQAKVTKDLGASIAKSTAASKEAITGAVGVGTKSAAKFGAETASATKETAASLFSGVIPALTAAVGWLAALFTDNATDATVAGFGKTYRGGVVGGRPTFAAGGMLPSNVSGTGGGALPIIAHEGEGVITKASMRLIGGAAGLEAINMGRIPEVEPRIDPVALGSAMGAMMIGGGRGGTFAPQIVVNASPGMDASMVAAIVSRRISESWEDFNRARGSS